MHDRAVPKRPPDSLGIGTAFRKISRASRIQPVPALSILFLITLSVMSMLGPLLLPYGPLEFDTSAVLAPPSLHHPLGTDNFGRDLLGRVLWGGRVSLGVSVVGLLLSVLCGFSVGLLSGYYMGPTDLAIQRLVDAMMAFPPLILAIALIAWMGTGITSVIVAIAIVFTPRVARIARASTISIREMPYVEATRSLGAPTMRILLRHIAPNTLTPLIVLVSANIGQAMLLEAAMSFLGLGVPLPHPSWGNMLTGDAQALAAQAPWMAIVPGLALTTTVLAFNFLGDALSDLTNPRRLSSGERVARQPG